MSELYNSPKLKQRRQWLRRKSTYSEKVLWQDLRNKRMSGFKFYRQFSIGNFVYDFYCPEKLLAIELDGISHTHPSVIENDKRKGLLLNQNRIRLLRFTDAELLEHYEEALKKIKDAVEGNGLTPPTPSC